MEFLLIELRVTYIYFLHIGCYVPALGNKLVLYSNGICAFSQRAHLVLHAKKIPYQAVYIDIFSKPEWFIQKSPLGFVPVLELPDKTGPIIDSIIIVEYLDDKYPENKMYSTDHYRRARDKILILRFNPVIELVEKIMFPTLYDTERDHEDVNVIHELAKQLMNGLDVFEKELIKRKNMFFGGILPNIVDYMIWPWYERLLCFSMMSSVFELDEKRFEKTVSHSFFVYKNENF